MKNSLLKNSSKVLLILILFVVCYHIATYLLAYTILLLGFKIEVLSVRANEALNSIVLVFFYVLSMICLPFTYFYVYSKIKDALYKKERELYLKLKNLYIFILAGMVYGYYTAIYFMIPFLYSFNAKLDVSTTISLENLILSIITNCILFSLIFITPFIIKYSIMYELLDKRKIKSNRNIIYFGFLIISAILTPSDILSMMIAFLPFVLLFELGLYLSKDK